MLCATLLVGMIIAGLFFVSEQLRPDTPMELASFTTSDAETVGDTLVLSGTLDVPLPAGETLWLYSEHAQISLSVREETFTFNTRSGVPAMFRSPGCGWFAVRGVEIAAGETVQLSVQSYYNQNDRAAEQLLTRLSLGDGSGLYGQMFGSIGFFGMLQWIALVSGLIYLGEGAIDVAMGMTQEGLHIGVLGLYCFTGGLWCITDVLYPYFSLLISPRWLATLFDSAGLLLFPIALAAMMRGYMRGKGTRRVLSAVLLGEIATAIICVAIQLAGIADLLEQQTIIGAVALAAWLIAIGCIVAELCVWRDGYLLLLLLTVLPVFVSVLLDGINVLWPFMPRRMLMRYSFGISVLMLVFQLFCYARAELLKAEAMRRMEKEVVSSRISIMLSQIQPHFLFNALLGIKQLCDTKPEKASDALEHFSYFLRGNLYSISDDRLIPFQKELEHTKDYLYLEKMRFEERLQVEWDIHFTAFTVPALTLQPIVENAVRYGITKRERGGTLIIRSEAVGDTVRVSVIDNGVGFDTSVLLDPSRPHIGLENVRKRIQAQCGGSMEVSSAPGKGTTIVITLPQAHTTAT